MKITKGTRTAALYAYSDVIYVLKAGSGSTYYCRCFGRQVCPYDVYSCCTTTGSRKCTELGRTCEHIVNKPYTETP